MLEAHVIHFIGSITLGLQAVAGQFLPTNGTGEAQSAHFVTSTRDNMIDE